MDTKKFITGQISLDEFRRRAMLYTRVRWIYLGAIGAAALIPLYVVGGTNSRALVPGIMVMATGLTSNLIFIWLQGAKRRGLLYFQGLTITFLLLDLVFIAYAVSLGSVTGFRTLVLFVIPILLSGILYGRRVTYLMAMSCSILLGAILYRAQIVGQVLLPDFWVAAIFYSAILLTISVLVGYLARISQGRELERAKTDLIALASHQLRTPATAVKGYLSLVLQGAYGDLTLDQRRQVAEAFLENERQLNLISSLLNVSSLDRGELSIHKIEIDLAGMSGMLGDIVAEHLELSRARKLKFRLEIPKESIKINADKERIRLVFQNLINNACKFAPEGSEVVLKLVDKGKDIEFSVSDKGKGISPGDRRKLFQRFSPLGGIKSHEGEGAGLGLFVSKRIVELHNGTISVKSSPGKGTTFIVNLPK